MYQYPYGNSQQLNLDWLLKEWIEFQQKVEDMIAPQYSNTDTYSQNEIRIHDHILYKAKTNINVPGEFNATQWEKISLTDN